jgi:hypothetical protein
MRSAATKILGPLTAIMLAAAPFWASGCKTVETMDTTAKPVKEAVSAFMSLGPPARAKTDYQLPARVLLCGEALPMDRPSVREKLEFEFIMAINHPAQVELWRRRAKRYFPLIEKKLREAGLPDDLKYLAVAESDLRPAVSSPAGAKGLWQFMPATARRFGVPVDKKQDQRGLPEPLLTAGMRYLSALRDRFGSWPLAMAAYTRARPESGAPSTPRAPGTISSLTWSTRPAATFTG